MFSYELLSYKSNVPPRSQQLHWLGIFLLLRLPVNTIIDIDLDMFWWGCLLMMFKKGSWTLYGILLFHLYYCCFMIFNVCNSNITGTFLLLRVAKCYVATEFGKSIYLIPFLNMLFHPRGTNGRRVIWSVGWVLTAWLFTARLFTASLKINERKIGPKIFCMVLSKLFCLFVNLNLTIMFTHGIKHKYKLTTYTRVIPIEQR